jgi:hypothetical protein
MEALEDFLQKRPRLWRLYVAANFCKGSYADGTGKPESRAYLLFYKIFYLGCPCCAALRGLIVGLAAGLAGGLLWR